MIDKWDIAYKAGEEIIVPVIIINDTYEDWNGGLKLSLIKGEQILNQLSNDVKIEKLGQSKTEFKISIPSEKGKYMLVAELEYNNEPIRSIREFEVKWSGRGARGGESGKKHGDEPETVIPIIKKHPD